MRRITMTTSTSLKMHSSVFTEGAPVPRRHTGDGEDLSPPLSWQGLPATARELALIVDDPDAPTEEPWVHWVIYNLPATLSGLPEGIAPAVHARVAPGAIQGKNSWNTIGYRGPAPPKGHGTHHYYFKLYALDTALRLPEGMDKPGLLKNMQGHIVAEAVLMGTYQR
jgi:Raf kinase inhibitor-like YbhB/YbcL family protein